MGNEKKINDDNTEHNTSAHGFKIKLPDSFVPIPAKNLNSVHEKDSVSSELWLIQVPHGFDVKNLASVDAGIFARNGSQTLKVKVKQDQDNQQTHPRPGQNRPGSKQYFTLHSYRDSPACQRLTTVGCKSKDIVLGQDLQHMMVVSEQVMPLQHETVLPSPRKPVPMPTGLQARCTTFGTGGEDQIDEATRPCKKHRKQKKSKDTDLVDSIEVPPDPPQIPIIRRKRKADEESITLHDFYSSPTKKAKKHKKNKTEMELDGSCSTLDKEDCKKSTEVGSSHKRKNKKIKHKQEKNGDKHNSAADTKDIDNPSSVVSDRNKSNTHSGAGTYSTSGASENHTVVQPKPTPIMVGQWSTDMFESSERQNKFLRLMGGFKKAAAEGNSSASPGTANQPAKKGLFGSLMPSVGGQTALTHSKAQNMNKRLELDFEQAIGFRGQRGVGLGFTPDPAEGKKFHIDINKTASKKFDD